MSFPGTVMPPDSLGETGGRPENCTFPLIPAPVGPGFPADGV
jgi:hypothetical protein